jgi:Glycoside hydrolase family 44
VLVIHMDGKGYRGCGLNWKGWFPLDACDDASRFTSLVFYIRQTTNDAKADLSVTLVDNVKHKEGETVSNTLQVLSDGGLEAIDGKWRRVVFPLARFTQGKPLQLSRLWGMDFVNNGDRALRFEIDKIGFSTEKSATARFSPGPAFAAHARVETDRIIGPISDAIYGVCGLPHNQLVEFGVPVTRWGGNPSSRYNWKLNVDAAGNDWYFKNRGQLITRLSDTGYLKLIQTNQAFGATAYITVPMIGWVAKDNSSYSFPVAKYGPQKATEPGANDVGNGIRPDGSFVTKNDPRDTSVPASPEFIEEAVRLVVQHAGPATSANGKQGVKYWTLDNEPMIWNSTHRDVFPGPLGYDELWNRSVHYAEAIKRADPGAKVAGFCSWGWLDLYFSGLDGVNNRKDYEAHGKVPIAEWFIMKCADYKKSHGGKALIDVFDFHWYPQAQVNGMAPYTSRGMDAKLNELRLRTTRDLWDPNYRQESWIRDVDTVPVQVIPRLKGWIAKHNPGMELCLGEYNFGGSDNVTGGLAQADTLGIIARGGLDLAFLWHTPEGSQVLGWQLFRSYDGHNSRWGEQLLSASSDNPDVSVFASRRKSDNALTIVAINKNLHGTCDLALDLGAVKGSQRIWRFDQDSGVKVVEVQQTSEKVDGKIALTLPAASASMVVVTP